MPPAASGIKLPTDTRLGSSALLLSLMLKQRNRHPVVWLGEELAGRINSARLPARQSLPARRVEASLSTATAANAGWALETSPGPRPWFVADSALEGTGFELSVPPSSIGHSDVSHRFRTARVAI